MKKEHAQPTECIECRNLILSYPGGATGYCRQNARYVETNSTCNRYRSTEKDRDGKKWNLIKSV